PPRALAADVAFLASPTLAGREPGTPESRRAAAYIAAAYDRLGLAGAFPRECAVGAACAPDHFQPFSFGGRVGRNVAAVVPGRDGALRAEYVVVGAHYDHLGRSTWSAYDPEAGDVVRPGADDNASGAAAVLELARRLAASPPRRSVLLVHFDAEELGLVGSRVFVEHAPVPTRAVALMLNLDMVGRLRDGRLTVEPSAAPAHVRALVDSAAARLGVRVVRSTSLADRSDHASFAKVRVPALMLTTGLHGDYHRATDVASRLDLAGLARVVDLAEAVVRVEAERDARADRP
ncbi:M20/M25/M40 family metallo-hydrolase, partial [Roseisolibacter sp. H3M3-2]|uniref:M20/M25/M40 family metallo-hydrolase n=1 Tax=Roseisolibacter sp. H3M3-2 TaxID=3031323 RepID=UPI0023DB0E80